MIPGDFESPISTGTKRFLPHDLRKEHASGPAPYLLAGGSINYCEIVSLACSKTKWDQFVRRIDDCQDELRPICDVCDLNIESYSFVGWFCDVLR